jgi:hypothetical protein
LAVVVALGPAVWDHRRELGRETKDARNRELRDLDESRRLLEAAIAERDDRIRYFECTSMRAPPVEYLQVAPIVNALLHFVDADEAVVLTQALQGQRKEEPAHGKENVSGHACGRDT